MDCVFCKDVRQQISQRILEGKSLEETRPASKPRNRLEEEVRMDTDKLLNTKNWCPAASRRITEENRGPMACKLVDGPEEE